MFRSFLDHLQANIF